MSIFDPLVSFFNIKYNINIIFNCLHLNTFRFPQSHFLTKVISQCPNSSLSVCTHIKVLVGSFRGLLHQDDFEENCRKTTGKLPLLRSFLAVFLQFSGSFLAVFLQFSCSFPSFFSQLGSVCKKGRKERRSFLVVFWKFSGSFPAVFR